MTTIQIGWRDNTIPMNTPIAALDLCRSSVIRKAVAHLAIEIGSRPAAKAKFALCRKLKQLAAMAERDGVWLQVHTTNQTTAPKAWDWINGLGVEVRAIKDNTILWDVQLCVTSTGSTSYRTVSTTGQVEISYHNYPCRADAAIRRFVAANRA